MPGIGGTEGKAMTKSKRSAERVVVIDELMAALEELIQRCEAFNASGDRPDGCNPHIDTRRARLAAARGRK